VEAHIAGKNKPITVELVDIAKGGVRLRSLADEVRLDQRVTLTFLVAGKGRCSAEGHVARMHNGQEFVVALAKANPSFRDFVLSLTR
jgi:hypothetical protein